MADLIIPAHTTLPSGEIVAVGVSAEEYMEKYAADHYEWVKGALIKMSPVSTVHDEITGYLYLLFKSYFAMKRIGIIKREPFVMRLDTVESKREPDLMVILNDNPGEFTDTAMIGAADICIEVVSRESRARDYGDKFNEYKTGGVREYWIIDPETRNADFYRLAASGDYELIAPDAESHHTTPLLPNFKLHVPILWQQPLPDYFQIGDAVKAMFAD